ncbi:MAG TPA: hypothetical protein PLI88_07495 [Bacillota bacterium]|nr:hypothetical protein [Bacillota bacterium]HOH10601.1 hypothetical protein [Bacillota bacterium]HOY89292.1 hypothetical protein [Bacillota bacterium]HPI01969.1 hypothetical protein [Bacillota bacterium]HPM63650.1 hypothetical protein [Bacillota bacterium]
MDKEILITRLKAKPDLNQFITEAIDNTTTLSSLFEIVLTETSSIKYVCTKIIRMVSEQKPELIYPYFEDISKWLHHKNSFIKWDGILTLSNLLAVDYEDKFGVIYQDYFALIQDPQMITAANAIGNAWRIVLAKPELESYITRRLLEVPKIIYMNKGEPSPECNCIVCGQVLECFEHYFDFSKNQTAMINFAKGQLGSRRKAVAKNAEEFLRRHSDKRV